MAVTTARAVEPAVASSAAVAPEEPAPRAAPKGAGVTAAEHAVPGSADPETASAASEVSATGTSTSETSASDTSATEAAEDGSAETGTATDHAPDPDAERTATETVPGRPHKSLLAGAAIVGALLISVPFLVGGDGDGGTRAAGKPGAAAGTVLDGQGGVVPGVVGSQSPPPHAPGTPGKQAPKAGVTGPDGTPATGPVIPPSHPSADGKKPASGGAPATGRHASGNADSGERAAGSKHTGAAASGTSSSGATKPSGSSGSGSASGSGSGSGSASGSGSGSGSGGTSGKSTTQQTAPPSDPWPGGVQIYGHASNRCIGVAGSPGAATGSALVIWDCYDVSYQRWKFVDGTVRSEGKCMNVVGGSRANGAAINWTTCNGSGAQQFRLNSSHDLTNPQSGNKCVDVKDMRTTNNGSLQLYTCAGTPNQKWSTRTP
ncbi:ricin-type beta-trefoil lectin domain protein [Streptomyces sp. NPDC048717]|uniref:ricin-type beta-trefoil lectin domain protein n=1 Tax=Streptomyces sp. NPDC048717 TaxID=3154928 RepID=UPI003439D81B